MHRTQINVNLAFNRYKFSAWFIFWLVSLSFFEILDGNEAQGSQLTHVHSRMYLKFHEEFQRSSAYVNANYFAYVFVLLHLICFCVINKNFPVFASCEKSSLLVTFILLFSTYVIIILTLSLLWRYYWIIVNVVNK